MSKIFKTDQGTHVSASDANQRVSLVIRKGFLTFSETMAPHDAIELGRALANAGHVASGAPLAAAAGQGGRA